MSNYLVKESFLWTLLKIVVRSETHKLHLETE